MGVHGQASRHSKPPTHQSRQRNSPSKSKDRVLKIARGASGTPHKGAAGSNSGGNVTANLQKPPIPVIEKPRPGPLSAYATLGFNPPIHFEGKDSLDSHPNYCSFLHKLGKIGITEKQIEQNRKIIKEYYTKAKGSDSLDQGPDFEIFLDNLFLA
jgi:hypothetical protein